MPNTIDRTLLISPQTPGWDLDLVGANINGPSLIRVPEWVREPLGRYYLYFGHHQGQSIRMAYANALEGPWTIHTPGVLPRSSTGFDHHIASPDVHVEAERLVMYFHGDRPVDPEVPWEQSSTVAYSSDGLDWKWSGRELGESYFRVFAYRGRRYAIAKAGILYREEGEQFEVRHGPLNVGPPGMGRHWAVYVDGDRLRVWFSRIFDTPEHIMEGEIDLTKPWSRWRVQSIRSVLKPLHDWEGANEPIEPSKGGAKHKPVHQLRDPAAYEENGTLYLLYSVAGERGIAITRLE